MEWLKSLIARKSTFILLYSILVAIVTFQAFNPSSPNDPNAQYHYVDYNNYVIFKKSFEHLTHQQNLYAHYPSEHDDLYKYTPTFAALFGFFILFPDVVGLYLWNFLNVILLLLGVYLLPRLSNLEKGIVLLLVVIELITSIQNEQSNGLMVGLILCAFGLLERGKYQWATLLIVISVYVKLFSIVAFILLLFYPKKLKSTVFTIIWFAAFFVIPLLFISVDQYMFLWDSYGGMLANDHSSSLGYSVMGILNSWFGLNPPKLGLVCFGIILFLIPYVKIESYKEQRFRMLALASLLIWTVIFNHKAESPTFIIAIVGVVIWFMISKKNGYSIGLLIFALLFTSLSSTDLFPPIIRQNFIKPYAIKAIGSIIVWGVVFFEMIRYHSNGEEMEREKDNLIA